MKRLAYFILFTVLLFSSCTEDINLNIVGGEDKIVVEGTIENGKPPVVIITRNSSVSKALNFDSILVLDADVYVSDGANEEKLFLWIDSASSIPVVYKGSSIIGTVGGTYKLTVNFRGKTYTATTTIPTPVALDSVWWQVDPPNDSVGYAWAHLTDPPGYGNAYRWFAKLPRDRRYIAPMGASFDDKFTENRSFDFYSLRSIDATSELEEDTGGGFDKYYYKKTDTVYIKFCTIDYAAFRFYYSYETALQSNGNPFASPTAVQSNISNGGLGVWAGFGATYDTIYPKP